ncbi:MAG: DUF5343 domain-containing protein [Candidatus Fermentibacteraceae bacterium]|nr:DUF5343 domain-containing protein [Candidatus Fermentibacteraceae bacterium]
MLLRTVSKTDPPKVVSHDYLVDLGFKREVDEGLLKLLSFLGFIDEKGHPTVLWVNYNDTDADADILRDSIRKAYVGLFDKYPRAYDEEGTVLMDFFRSSTGASDSNTAYMILTFKVLCDLAEMGEEKKEPKVQRKLKPASPPTPVAKDTSEKRAGPRVAPAEPGPAGKTNLRVSLNIDFDREADPELRDLVIRLLKRQLEL